MNSTIVSSGNTYRLYDSAVKTHEVLPVGTYQIDFSPLSGYSLNRIDDLKVGDEHVYGDHPRLVKRVLRTYQTGSRSLGLLMSGEKGMGKSLMLRMTAEETQRELGLPVIIVKKNSPGIAEFIDTIAEAIVVFDEFEKVFPSDDNEGDNQQHQFLSLFDGMSTQKRLYVLAINKIDKVSEYLVNRPGRFHYHLRFDYPKTAQVREYLTSEAPNAEKEQIEAAVAFSQKVNLNYDHLRAIAFELNLGDPFEDFISFLNIKRVTAANYRFQVTFSDGSVCSTTSPLDLFGSDGDATTSVFFRNPGTKFGRFQIEFMPDNVVEAAHGLSIRPEDIVELDFYDLDNRIYRDPDAKEVDDDPKLIDPPTITSLKITLVGQRDIGY